MNIILLSGGSGKRLWPLSNDVRSKQFIKLFKNNDEYESMVQRVYRQITTVDTERRKIIKLHSSLRLLLSNFPEHLSLHICCMKKVFTSRQRKRTKSVWVQSGSEDTER